MPWTLFFYGQSMIIMIIILSPTGCQTVPWGLSAWCDTIDPLMHFRFQLRNLSRGSIIEGISSDRQIATIHCCYHWRSFSKRLVSLSMAMSGLVNGDRWSPICNLKELNFRFFIENFSKKREDSEAQNCAEVNRPNEKSRSQIESFNLKLWG